MDVEVMYRSVGWNERDEIVMYGLPRRAFEAAENDAVHAFGLDGVFSTGVETRWVEAGSVTFVDAPKAEKAAKTPPKKATHAAKKAKAPAKD